MVQHTHVQPMKSECLVEERHTGHGSMKSVTCLSASISAFAVIARVCNLQEVREVHVTLH